MYKETLESFNVVTLVERVFGQFANQCGKFYFKIFILTF